MRRVTQLELDRVGGIWLNHEHFVMNEKQSRTKSGGSGYEAKVARYRITRLRLVSVIR